MGKYAGKLNFPQDQSQANTVSDFSWLTKSFKFSVAFFFSMKKIFMAQYFQGFDLCFNLEKKELRKFSQALGFQYDNSEVQLFLDVFHLFF